MKQVEEKDGIHKLNFAGAGGSVGRDQAVQEWREYLNSFTSIEAFGLYIDRLEQYRDPAQLQATIRFEAIGTPQGQTRNVIDRAIFRFGFRESANGPVITSGAWYRDSASSETARSSPTWRIPPASISSTSSSPTF